MKGAGKPSKRRGIEPLTPGQVREIADDMPDRWGLGVPLGAWCALRSGEVRELRRKDIDLSRGLIKVTRGVTHAGQRTQHIGDPKTEAGIRTVRIPASILADVKTHLHEHAQLGQNGLLFWRDDGVHVTDTALVGATTRELQVAAGHTTPTMALRYQDVAANHMDDVVKTLDAMITGQLDR